MNALLSERLVVAGAIDPDAYTNSTYTTGAIDVSLYEELMFIGTVGTLGSSATAIFSVVGDSVSGGSYAAAVTGKTATTLTQAGADSDKQVVINLRGADLLAQGFRYVKGKMVIGVAASDSGLLVLGIKKDGGCDPLNNLMSELFAIVGVVDPDANAQGNLDTDVIDMGKFGQACAFVMVGDIGATSTVAGQWYQATSSGKAGEKAITSKSHSALSGAASPNPSNQQIAINIRAEELDLANGFRYAYFRQVVDDTTSPQTQTSDSAVVAVAGDIRFGVAADNDLASVDEIIA